MIIALMGNDGSGKTTIAKELSKFFRDGGFEVIYKHEYEYAILKFLFRLIGMRKINEERRKMIVERRKSWKYYLWPFLIWFDIFLQYLYFKLFKRRAIVILDRYPYDHYLSFKYLGYVTPLSEWFYLHFPKPDVGIILWVESEVAYERKKSTHNYSLSFYEIQTKNYLSLAKKLGISAINTNKSKKETLDDVVGLIIRKKPRILHRLIQNRIIFYVIKKYKLKNEIIKKLLREHKKRKEMFKRSLEVLKTILEDLKIEKYTLIKTLDNFEWIGNDIDVLISPSDFDKLLQNVSKIKKSYPIEEIRHDKWDVGKMDIFIKNGLKLDIHSYMGWRNVRYLAFDQIFRKSLIQRKDIFGMECTSVKDEMNAIIIITTHIFEKGFLTLDEYLFLKKHFRKDTLDKFPSLSELLNEYVSWLEEILNRPPVQFPMFVPNRRILNGYLKLIKVNNSNRIWKLKALIRDLLFMNFWKIRYKLREKLPFDVKFYGS